MPALAFAWGASGHRIISQLAAEKLPEEVPAFLRTPLAARQIGELGRELDRSKGAGATHDTAWDPAHWVNVEDDGTIAGVVKLSELPDRRSEYDRLLYAKKTSPYVWGFLPYAIIEGWQQLTKDFAYWRADTWGEQNGATPEQRAWFAEDRALRELLILRDLGVWSHYVGDASQPLHTSVHYNGWGPGPNLNGYTQSNRTHANFEGAFVRANVTAAMVAERMRPYAECQCTIHERAAKLIAASNAQVERLYQLEKAGAFDKDKDATVGSAFVAERLAFGASELRDLVVDAWRASLEQTVGFPPVPVSSVLGGVNPYGAMRAAD
ncbi:MAG TPA: S1/P1 Nuclease [bacterium]